MSRRGANAPRRRGGFVAGPCFSQRCQCVGAPCPPPGLRAAPRPTPRAHRPGNGVVRDHETPPPARRCGLGHGAWHRTPRGPLELRWARFPHPWCVRGWCLRVFASSPRPGDLSSHPAGVSVRFGRPAAGPGRRQFGCRIDRAATSRRFRGGSWFPPTVPVRQCPMSAAGSGGCARRVWDGGTAGTGGAPTGLAPPPWAGGARGVRHGRGLVRGSARRPVGRRSHLGPQTRLASRGPSRVAWGATPGAEGRHRAGVAGGRRSAGERVIRPPWLRR